jgi:hypothetical protein
MQGVCKENLVVNGSRFQGPRITLDVGEDLFEVADAKERLKIGMTESH